MAGVTDHWHLIIVSFVNLQSVIDNGNGLFWGLYSAGIYDGRGNDIFFAVSVKKKKNEGFSCIWGVESS